MAEKETSIKYWCEARNFRARAMFHAIRRHCRGKVLDLGGWDFFLTAKSEKLSFDSWTTLEISDEKLPIIHDPRFKFEVGDGCRMKFPDGAFDTVLNLQVLEHVFEPIKMMEEIARVLKPKGRGILLIPQTSTLHCAPEHYYNFTRYWILEAVKRAKLEIVELTPIGGIWSTMASRLFFFFLQSIRFKGMSVPEIKRNFLFYPLYPLMVLYAAVSIPVCLVLSLGDLAEEPNNYLVVVSKP